MIEEVAKCMADPAYFINNFCFVQDASHAGASTEDFDRAEEMTGLWVPFTLWPAQYKPLRALHLEQYVCWLKARQLGLTWLSLAYANWTRLFVDGSTVLLFSRRDTEAIDLLSRMCGMFDRLPGWMKPRGSYDSRGRLANKSSHRWNGPDGGRVMAFPCSAGDSYTATLAIVDEADLVPNLDQLLSSVKPTIDAGGKLVLISRVDKSKPNSAFKNVYRSGRAGETSVKVCFLPWYARESRTHEWYEEQKRESLGRTFSLDYLWEQYPATDDEALAAKQLDKRFPQDAMSAANVYEPATDLTKTQEWPVARWAIQKDAPKPTPESTGVPGIKIISPGGVVKPPGDMGASQDGDWDEVIAPCPRIPGLRVYKVPNVGTRARAGVDPAQGVPGGHDSPFVFVDRDTGEELCTLRGKFAPKVLARYAAEICDWYSAPPEADCKVMVERNNHGHAFILWWESNRREEQLKAQLCRGPDGHYGWNQTASTKETMYHRAAQRVTDKRCIIHSRDVYDQVLDLEASTLSAPEGSADDLAVAWGLAMAASDLSSPRNKWEVKNYG